MEPIKNPKSLMNLEPLYPFYDRRYDPNPLYLKNITKEPINVRCIQATICPDSLNILCPENKDNKEILELIESKQLELIEGEYSFDFDFDDEPCQRERLTDGNLPHATRTIVRKGTTARLDAAQPKLSKKELDEFNRSVDEWNRENVGRAKFSKDSEDIKFADLDSFQFETVLRTYRKTLKNIKTK